MKNKIDHFIDVLIEARNDQHATADEQEDEAAQKRILENCVELAKLVEYLEDLK